jgi:hypothetical protein
MVVAGEGMSEHETDGLDELLSSTIDDFDSFTDEYKDECRQKIKEYFLDRIDNAKSLKELREYISQL